MKTNAATSPSLTCKTALKTMKQEMTRQDLRNSRAKRRRVRKLIPTMCMSAFKANANEIVFFAVDGSPELASWSAFGSSKTVSDDVSLLTHRQL